jgi:hypothetical protein
MENKVVGVTLPIYLLCKELERLEESEQVIFSVSYSFADFWAERKTKRKDYSKMLPKEDMYEK